MPYARWAEHAYSLAEQAGKCILTHYTPSIDSRAKSDGSPVTAADLASHHLIFDGLKNYALDENGPAPILSEEGPSIPFSERQHWERYWCIDPLDGTREFLAHNGEFTVNIALIAEGRPVIGIIYVPVEERGYLAWQGGGAFLQHDDTRTRIHTQRPPHQPLRMLLSAHARAKALLPPWVPATHTRTHQGSALKFCTLALGNADIFFRFSPTSEWDNAAGECLLQEAGGALFTATWEQLSYNQPTLRHGNIIALGDATFPWCSDFLREISRQS